MKCFKCRQEIHGSHVCFAGRRQYRKPAVVETKPVPLSAVMSEYMAALQEHEIEVSETELRQYEQFMEEQFTQQLATGEGIDE